MRHHAPDGTILYTGRPLPRRVPPSAGRRDADVRASSPPAALIAALSAGLAVLAVLGPLLVACRPRACRQRGGASRGDATLLSSKGNVAARSDGPQVALEAIAMHQNGEGARATTGGRPLAWRLTTLQCTLALTTRPALRAPGQRSSAGCGGNVALAARGARGGACAAPLGGVFEQSTAFHDIYTTIFATDGEAHLWLPLGALSAVPRPRSLVHGTPYRTRHVSRRELLRRSHLTCSLAPSFASSRRT